MILAGDIGATKILLEVGEFRNGRWTAALARRYATAEAASFSAVLDDFTAAWKSAAPPRARITAAGFGAAGPAIDGRVKMTHRPLDIDSRAIASRLAVKRVRVVNDLEATAHGLALLGPRELATLQPGRAVPGFPRVVIGVGTGLGVAYMIPEGEGWRVVGGEAGHAGFSPASAAQWQLFHALAARRGRLEAEEVASGMGLEAIRGVVGEGDEALGLFAECLGNVAGDHALAVLARGGVYLAGGVVVRTIPQLPRERWRAAFCAKGSQSALLMRIPVKAVLNERCALLGAARLVM